MRPADGTACTIILPTRRRSDFWIDLVPDEGSFRWRLRRVVSPEPPSLMSAPFPDVVACVADLWLTTGWLPDGVDEAAAWDAEALMLLAS